MDSTSVLKAIIVLVEHGMQRSSSALQARSTTELVWMRRQTACHVLVASSVMSGGLADRTGCVVLDISVVRVQTQQLLNLETRLTSVRLDPTAPKVCNLVRFFFVKVDSASSVSTWRLLIEPVLRPERDLLQANLDATHALQVWMILFHVQLVHTVQQKVSTLNTSV